MRLKNRVAFVTGGGRGIGRAISLALAGEGARVAVAARTAEQVESVAREICEAGGEALPLVCDVTDGRSVADAVAATVERWHALHVLVNNAGAAEATRLLECDEETWLRTIDVNLNGTFRCTRAALPHMLAAGSGRIINIASAGARIPIPSAPAYTASKHAVLGFTRSLAAEFGAKGITANAICPGWVETDMADAAITRMMAKSGRTREQARQTLEAVSPQRRLFQPEEIAAVAVLLASDDGRGINGQAINVCGGTVMS